MSFVLLGGCGLLGETVPVGDMPVLPPENGDIRTARFGEDVVRYEVVGDNAIIEGDINLGPVDALEARADSARTTGVGQSRRGLSGLRPRGIFHVIWGEAAPWPDATQIPYRLVGSSYGMPAAQTIEGHVLDAIAELERRTNVRLVPHDDQDNYILIRNFFPFERPAGACGVSSVGMQGGAQLLLLDPTADYGCVLHEILHAIGVAHEQSRSDRDLFVEIVEQNITDGNEHNFDRNQFLVYEDFTPYDFDSLMHYRASAFNRSGVCTSADQSGCTIKPRDPDIDITRLGQRVGLSAFDQAGLCQMYGPSDTDLSFAITNSEFPGATPSFQTVIPRAEVSLSRAGERPAAEVVFHSDIDGEIVPRRSHAPNAAGSFAVDLPVRTPGRHVISVTSFTGCPQTKTLELELIAGGRVELVVDEVREGADFGARLVTASSLTPEQEAGSLWTLRRVGFETEVAIGMGDVIAGRRFAGVCDGDYAVHVQVPGLVGASATIEAALLRVIEDPAAPAPACQPAVTIIEPVAQTTVLRGTSVDLVASFDDDQPQIDTPLSPITWVDLDAGTILGRGVTTTTRFDRVGAVRIEARYEGATDVVTLNVVDNGTPPVVQILAPAAGREYLLDTDVIGNVLRTQFRASVSHPTDTIPDQQIEWLVTCPNTPTGGPAGQGRVADVALRVFHEDLLPCEVRVRATGLDGLVSSISVPVSIQGEPQ